MPRFDHLCLKCKLPLTWDATRNAWVTIRVREAVCSAGGRHEAVR